MACPSKQAGARRAPSPTWSGTGPDAPRPGAGRSRDTSKEQAMTLGRRRFLGTGAAAALAAALAIGQPRAQPAAASFPYALSDAQWRERLSREEYEVLRREATERPYSSPLNNEHRKGLYTCAGCAHKLFSSDRSSTAAPAGPASGSPAGRRGRDRGPHLRHGPHGGALRQLWRPSGTRVRRRPAPDRPALLHERRRAAFHGAELRHTRRLTPKP